MPLQHIRKRALALAAGLMLFNAPMVSLVAPVHSKESIMTEKQAIADRLHDHLHALTRTIGERSVRQPDNLRKTAAYIQAYYEKIGIPNHLEPYRYGKMEVSNVVAGWPVSQTPQKHYLLGAHYDCVTGTVGADDNASAIAVQLETARALKAMGTLDANVTFVSFALEEPPVYDTPHMGSRVYAAKARKQNIPIDGMICLEMVGYTCRQAGCQDYPFPLKYLGYPEKGDFIGIVGNLKSLALSRGLRRRFRQNPNLPVVSLTVPLSGWLMPAVRLSDHASFWDQGYRAVMVTDSAFFRNPHYHRPSDTMQTLDFDYMTELVMSLVSFFKSSN